jgi:hypothetical protein
MLRPSAVYPVLAGALLLALTSTESWAMKRRPTISTPQQCTIDAVGGQADLGCEGAICWCCYSDGCYICNSSGADCVWDPGGASSRVEGLDGVFEGQLNQGVTILPQTTLPEGGLDGTLEQGQ